MQCTLCESELEKQVDNQYFECETCGAYVMNSQQWLGAEDEKARYDTHNNDISDPGYRKFVSPIADAILRDFLSEHHGLDYGCGPGPVIAAILRENNYSIDLFDPFYYPNYRFLEKQYDFIFSCEVFEHFFNPKQEIEKLLGLLKPNGKLYIMTHIYDSKIEVDFSKWYYRKDPSHVFIYTPKTIKYISENFEMELENHDGRLVVFQKS